MKIVKRYKYEYNRFKIPYKSHRIYINSVLLSKDNEIILYHKSLHNELNLMTLLSRISCGTYTRHMTIFELHTIYFSAFMLITEYADDYIKCILNYCKKLK